MTEYGSHNSSESSSRTEIQYEVYEVHRGEIGRQHENYDKIFYRNCFQVSGGPVYLLAVSFFGPAEGDSTTYDARVSVDSPLWEYEYPCCYFYLCCFQETVKNYGVAEARGEVRQRDKFSVRFDKPIFIPESTWVEISFSIKSKKKLACLDPDKPNNSVKIKTEDGIRKFTFLRGSLQLPTIEFAVKNPLGKNSTTV